MTRSRKTSSHFETPAILFTHGCHYRILLFHDLNFMFSFNFSLKKITSYLFIKRINMHIILFKEWGGKERMKIWMGIVFLTFINFIFFLICEKEWKPYFMKYCPSRSTFSSLLLLLRANIHSGQNLTTESFWSRLLSFL